MDHCCASYVVCAVNIAFHVAIVPCRDIKLNLKRNLIEVKSETKEAIFEIVGSEGETETYSVSVWKRQRQLISS